MNPDEHFPAAESGPKPKPPTREQIEALAHAIWKDRGSPEGFELDHWFEAERQLRDDARVSPPHDSGAGPGTDPDRG